MDFTVLIPSRNRTALLDRAIQSVLTQEHASFEILVIDDGSEGEHAEGYRALAQRYAGKTRFLHLDLRTAPHGKSSAINVGLAHAEGEFIAFLDDDDYWLRKDYLAAAREAIVANGANVDLLLANQRAGRDGVDTESGWIAALGADLARRAVPPDTCGMHWVSVETLLDQPSFCHMNTMVIRRSLFERMRGFDETIIYEEDRDFFIRAIDQAKGILYRPVITSYHSIPDPAKTDNLSTVATPVQKLLTQLAFYNKNLIYARHPEIRKRIRLAKRYAIKDLAIIHQKSGNFTVSFHYAREALLLGFTLKWMLYTTWMGVRALGSKDERRID